MSYILCYSSWIYFVLLRKLICVHIISLLSVIHNINSIIQTNIRGLHFCIILYMVCMTDNKLIIYVNRKTPGWQICNICTLKFNRIKVNEHWTFDVKIKIILKLKNDSSSNRDLGMRGFVMSLCVLRLAWKIAALNKRQKRNTVRKFCLLLLLNECNFQGFTKIVYNISNWWENSCLFGREFECPCGVGSKYVVP